MADYMEFPKTMEEFIEGYSFNDSEKVYTNGIDLIPVYRVIQGFGHYEQEIRNKAIDEFVEKFKQDTLERIYDISERQRNYEVGSEMSIMHSHVMGTLWGIYNTGIDEIAEQMKGET